MEQSHLTKQQIAKSIRLVQDQIRWKPNSAVRHLKKRKNRGHLETNATLDTYHAIIHQVINAAEAHVYLFHYSEDYPAMVTLLGERHWLVMFSIEGIMETAFMVKRPNTYLNKSNVEYLGTLEEILT